MWVSLFLYPNIYYNVDMAGSTFMTIVYALIAGVLPSLIWLAFWLREDSHSEPRSLITAIFFGGVLAVVVAILVEGYIGKVVTDQKLQYALWAATEEILKFIVVASIAIRSASYDEPIDAMVYCIVAALGFAALENTLFILDPFSKGLMARGILSDNMRFMGATLVHIASSATVGAFLGFTFYRSRLAKMIAIVLGLVVAIGLHTSFNLSLMNSIDWSDTLRTFAWFWGAIVILMILFEEVKVVRPGVL